MDKHKDFLMHFPSMSAMAKSQWPVVMDKLSSSDTLALYHVSICRVSSSSSSYTTC